MFGSVSAIFTENLEGVLLKKIGIVKVSNRQHVLSWIVDLDDLRSELENLESRIKSVKNSVCKTDLCLEKIEILEENQRKNQIMFDSIADSFDDKISRSKQEIRSKHGNNSNDESVGVEKVSSDNNSLGFHQKLHETDKVRKVEIALKRFENKLEAILITKRTKRFAGNLDEVEKNLENDFKLIKIPAGLVLGMSLNKALKFQKIQSKFSNNEIKFSMKIPCVENKIYDFYELIVNPVIKKSFVLMLNTESNYIALDEDFNGKLFNDLSNCIKTGDELFICEVDEKSSKTDDCLQKMTLIGKSQACLEQIFIAKLPESALIERSDGIFWKHSKDEVKFLSCNEKNQAINEDECEVIDGIDQKVFTLKFFYSDYLEIPEDMTPKQLVNNKIYNRDDFFSTAVQLSKIRKSKSFFDSIQITLVCSNSIMAVCIFAVTVFAILTFMIRQRSAEEVVQEYFTKMKMLDISEA